MQRVSSLANGQPQPLEACTPNAKRPAADLPRPPRTMARGCVGAKAPRATRNPQSAAEDVRRARGGKDALSCREPQG